VLPAILTAGDGLFRAILEEPRRDDLRLIYADWLDEHGEPGRAEFIRVQVELALVEAIEHDCSNELAFSETTCPACGAWVTAEALRQREGELLAAPAVEEHVGAIIGDCYVDWRLRRGLAEEVTLATADFLPRAAALFGAAPILRVMLADREPLAGSDGLWRWYGDEFGGDGETEADLPRGIFDWLRGPPRGYYLCRSYLTEEDARGDLCLAAVQFGRAAAGLPPLS
jgi:uncharacterized protein (TIGR02996 family)